MAFNHGNLSCFMLWSCAIAIALIGIQPEGAHGLDDDYWTKRTALQNWKISTECLHIRKNTTGTLELNPCDVSDEAQQLNTYDWKYYSSTPGVIKFENGLCAMPKKGGATSGTLVIVSTCLDTAGDPPPIQQWKINNGDYSGLFQLKNVKTGLCLTAEQSAHAIDQTDCEVYRSKAPQQFWRIIPAPKKINKKCIRDGAACANGSWEEQCCSGLSCRSERNETICGKCGKIGDSCAVEKRCCRAQVAGPTYKCDGNPPVCMA